MVRRFSLLALNSLINDLARDGSHVLAGVSALAAGSSHGPGTPQEHPSSPCPSGTATRTQGLGRSPPGRGRKLFTHRRIVKKRKNKAKVLAETVIIPNTPQRGSMQLLCLTLGTKGKGKDEPARPSSRQPVEATRTASGP